MFSSVQSKNFKAVPYLETSQLMQSHQGLVSFSLLRPNVVVGPNGAGKSALLTALSLATLSFFTGDSALDGHYVGLSSDDFWTHEGWRTSEQHFLQGLELGASDLGAAIYFRPNHIPGNEEMIASSMMTGYFDKAREYGRMVKEKSSGQGGQARLAQMHDVLAGRIRPEYGVINWRGPIKPVKFENPYQACAYEHQCNVLRERVTAIKSAEVTPIPVALLDEPEQSLDARAELELWKAIESANVDNLQVIVATHSLYPVMHPEKFHIIEAVPGYLKSVRDLL